VSSKELTPSNGLLKPSLLHHIARQESNRELVSRTVGVDDGRRRRDRGEMAEAVSCAHATSLGAHPGDHHAVVASRKQVPGSGSNVSVVDAGKEDDVGAFNEIPSIRVIQIDDILQVATDDYTLFSRWPEQFSAPVFEVDVHQLGTREGVAASVEIRTDLHVSFPIIEVLAPTISVHEVDTAMCAEGIIE
jgi:hypothetical protein